MLTGAPAVLGFQRHAQPFRFFFPFISSASCQPCLMQPCISSSLPYSPTKAVASILADQLSWPQQTDGPLLLAKTISCGVVERFRPSFHVATRWHSQCRADRIPVHLVFVITASASQVPDLRVGTGHFRAGGVSVLAAQASLSACDLQRGGLGTRGTYCTYAVSTIASMSRHVMASISRPRTCQIGSSALCRLSTWPDMLYPFQWFKETPVHDDQL